MYSEMPIGDGEAQEGMAPVHVRLAIEAVSISSQTMKNRQLGRRTLVALTTTTTMTATMMMLAVRSEGVESARALASCVRPFQIWMWTKRITLAGLNSWSRVHGVCSFCALTCCA